MAIIPGLGILDFAVWQSRGGRPEFLSAVPCVGCEYPVGSSTVPHYQYSFYLFPDLKLSMTTPADESVSYHHGVFQQGYRDGAVVNLACIKTIPASLIAISLRLSLHYHCLVQCQYNEQGHLPNRPPAIRFDLVLLDYYSAPSELLEKLAADIAGWWMEVPSHVSTLSPW